MFSWDLGVCQKEGYLFGGPQNKDSSISGSRLGSPYLGNLIWEKVWALGAKVWALSMKVQEPQGGALISINTVGT